MARCIMENLSLRYRFRWDFDPVNRIRLKIKLLLIILILSQPGCSRYPSIVIDENLVPSVSELPGLNGGPARPVAVAVEPDGKRTEFVVNEVTLVPRSEQDLNDFLAEYEGVVLRGGAPNTRPYLIQVDLAETSWDDLASNLAEVQDHGNFTFSSEEAAKLAALVVRETRTRIIEANLLLYPEAIEEHPDGLGGFIDWETRQWMTEDDEPLTDGDQGLSIGVTHAWEYLEYGGIPTFQGRGKVAVIDAGFALDENSGFPLVGNDFTRTSSNRPVQIDVIDDDGTAGGANSRPCAGGGPCPWHGTNAFAVAAAVNSNRFGGAGTGGNFTSAVLFKVDGTVGLIIDAIYRAVDDFDVDVINLSLGGYCGFWCDVGQFFGVGEPFCLQLAVNHADNNGTIVVAGSGNDTIDLANAEYIPAELEPVICVGSIDYDGNNLFNYGSSVDIWAPTFILSTVTPRSAMPDNNNVGIDELYVFGGTSASAPFVSGIVALMKALDESITTNEAVEILKNTANFNTADVTAGPLVTGGWVDAYRAVSNVSPNKQPVVNIVWPPQGEDFFQDWTISLLARVQDPELDARGLSFTGEVVFSESGVELCRDSGPLASCTLPPPLDPGVHQITATAIDEFGAVGSEVVEFEIVNRPPVARIDFPKAPETTFCADQELCFSGTGYDHDDTSPGAVSIEWTTADGTVLGTDRHFCTTLAAGIQDITLTVTDFGGKSATDNVRIDILTSCGRPSTKILSPAPFAAFGNGQSITFEGIGTDPEDGTIPGDNLIWYSNIDGRLGQGSTITTTLTSKQDLEGFDGVLYHTISLSATDSEGNEGTTDRIVVLVGAIIID